MRVNREPDICSVRAKLDCQSGFRNEIAGGGPDDAAADDALVAFIKNDLRDSLVAPKGQRAAACRPGEDALAVFDAFGFHLVLGQSDPGDLWVGVSDRRNDLRVEEAVLASCILRGDLAFMR